MQWKMIDLVHSDGSRSKMCVFEAKRFIYWGETLNYAYIDKLLAYTALADEQLTVRDVKADPSLITTEMRAAWKVLF